MKPTAIRPLFLVGCPRSGTTLLQSLLAAHSQVVSFPESKFFQYLVPEYEPKRYRIGLASRRLRPMLERFFQEIGYPEMERRLPRVPLFMGQYTRLFIKLLNDITQAQGKGLWLEKTPEHLHYLDYIEKFVPSARIIHIVRNGADVVASVYEMTQKYPDSWWGKTYTDLDCCIDQWMQKLEISRRYLAKPNHSLVRYERLVENPRQVLQELCQFLEIEFEESMLHKYGGVAQGLIRPRETWKAATSGAIQNANGTKFARVFNQTQQQYILERLSKVKMDELSLT